MEQETVTIPRRVYEEMLEEIGILRNPEIIEALKENEKAKIKGVKTWEIRY